MAKSSVSNSGSSNSSYSSMANDPNYQQWCRQQFRTDYSDPELLAEYNYLKSQGMV
jgi:hypothetical protein